MAVQLVWSVTVAFRTFVVSSRVHVVGDISESNLLLGGCLSNGPFSQHCCTYNHTFSQLYLQPYSTYHSSSRDSPQYLLHLVTSTIFRSHNHCLFQSAETASDDKDARANIESAYGTSARSRYSWEQWSGRVTEIIRSVFR
jgi:hypothetical protein